MKKPTHECPPLPTLTEISLRPIIAMPALARMHAAEIAGLIQRMFAQPADATLFMNQFQLFSTLGNRDFALAMQAKALELTPLYRIAGSKTPSVKLLALMTAGDSSDNTPLEYLIEDSDIQLDLLYILPAHPLPSFIPEHDVAIVAAGASARNGPVLEMIDKLSANWPRPVLNPVNNIMRCARDVLYQLLNAIPNLVIPPTMRCTRGELEKGLPAYPATIRPLDSQAGRGLSRIDNIQELAAYLDVEQAEEFHVSRFIDYQSRDGLYRKLRIALVDKQPYLCHLAISNNWIVHYGSSGMMESAEKRSEEAAFMRNFDSGFMPRHGDALRLIAKRLQLDYVVIDCAETQDGELLVFEADNRGWVHATDPSDLFPYKQAPMQRVFSAFRAMLLKSADKACS